MTDPTAVRELQGLIDERVAAIAARDGARLKAQQHTDVLAFNVLPPLKLTGNDTVEEQTPAWFTAYRDGPHTEFTTYTSTRNAISGTARSSTT